MKKIFAFVLSLLLGFGCYHLQAEEDVIYIKAGKLFNGKDDAFRENVIIKIQGTQIISVQQDAPLPADAAVIDLSNLTVLPGLIDTHTHIVLHPGNYENQIMKETPEYRAIYGTLNARATLEAGITTIRDAGNEGAGLADVALRDAIDNGLVPGPRILAAIQPVSGTGAYALTGFSPYLEVPHLSYEADGPDEIRKQVRQLVKDGADVIKLYLESYEKKQLRKDLLTGAMNYSPEELRVLVEEAHRAGLKVAAHTYSDEAARLAVRVNVNSIEHGLYLSEETFRLMAEKDIYYVPTLLVYELWRDGKLFGEVSPETKLKLTNTVNEHIKTFQRALITPVKIAFGSDTFELPGSNAQELELMVKYGMKPLDVLKSATFIAAELLDLVNVTGTIENGKSADIIAVTGDPLKDISVLQKVVFVMKEGKVYVWERGEG